MAVHFVPNSGPWREGFKINPWDSPRVGPSIYHFSESPGEAAMQPTRLLLHPLTVTSIRLRVH